MRFDNVLVPASFVHRDNRFRVTVELDGQLTAAYLPNSGRLGELLTFGRRVWLRPVSGPARRTRYDLLLVEHAGTMVSVDNRCQRRIGFVDLHVLRGTIAQTAIVDHGQGYLVVACRSETVSHVNTAAGGR